MAFPGCAVRVVRKKHLSSSLSRERAFPLFREPQLLPARSDTTEHTPVAYLRADASTYELSRRRICFRGKRSSSLPSDVLRLIFISKFRRDVVVTAAEQRPCRLPVEMTFPRWSTQRRFFSTSYLPKAALRRNRVPYHAFQTPRSAHPFGALCEAEAAAAVTAEASHVSAPFTLQKQQRLYALLCAEDKRPVDMASLFSASVSTNADSRLPFASGGIDAPTQVPHLDETVTLSTASPAAPVGISGLLKFHPSSPAASNFTFRGRVLRQLSSRRINHLGRNCTGQITVRYTGAGHFQRLRLVDFKRGRKDIFATVLRLEYDPGRSAHLALIQYDDGVLSYILAAQTTRPGDRVVASEYASITPANCLPLRCIPVSSIVHNIEIRPGAGGQLVRAAGCFATVIAKDANFATLKLQSTEVRRFPLACWASIGQVSNSRQAARIRGKAGVSYWMGQRPRTRGKAMNPVDHPHGGGTGKKGLKRPR